MEKIEQLEARVVESERKIELLVGMVDVIMGNLRRYSHLADSAQVALNEINKVTKELGNATIKE